MTHPLRALLTAVESPEEALNRSFDGARDWLLGEARPSVALIEARLALGDHGGTLDLLRAWTRAGGPSAEALDAFAFWTGDETWIARLAPGGKPRSPPEINIDVELALEAWRATLDPDSLMAASGVVGAAVYGLWGVQPDAPTQSVAIEPTLPKDWTRMALRQLRIGQTLLDVVVRRTRSGVTVSVVRNRGPGLRLSLTLPGFARFEVDGEQLGGGRAVFRVEGEHQVTARA